MWRISTVSNALETPYIELSREGKTGLRTLTNFYLPKDLVV